MWPTAQRDATAAAVTGIPVVEGVRIPGNTRTARGTVQRTTTAAPAAASVSTGEYDGTLHDANPDGAALRGATDDDARSHANAHDAAAANAAAAATATSDNGATANDGTDGAIISRGTAAAATRRAAIGPAAALCRIWNGSTNGEELLTVRGGKTGSFKQ